MGLAVKKLVLFLPLLIFFFSNQSCQSLSKNNFEKNDTARTRHARQLLQKNYSRSVAKEFERDKKFESYLETYISQENAKIDSAELSESLKEHFGDEFLCGFECGDKMLGNDKRCVF